MRKSPSRAGTMAAVAWKRLADISTAAWLWSLAPSGAASVTAGWLAYGEGLPKSVVALIALAVLTLVMLLITGVRIWRTLPVPSGVSAEDLAYREEMARQKARQDAKRKRDMDRVEAGLFGGNLAKSWEAIEKDREAEAEANRQRMIREARETPRPRPDAWVPLHAALRYLVYDSEWGYQQTQPASRADFDRLVSLEIRERLARGELRARGAKGDAFSNPDRPTEEIPPNYWIHGFIQPHGEIVIADPNRAAAGNPTGRDTYRRVIISSDDLISIWPRSSAAAISALASFVEPERKEFEASKAAVGGAPLADAIVLPDITLGEVIDRVLRKRGLTDDGSPEALKIIRDIGREIGDQMSLRRLSTWARRGGTLEPLPFEISKKGVGIGRDAAGNIHHMLQYRDENDTLRNVTDYRFLDAEISEVWPDQ